MKPVHVVSLAVVALMPVAPSTCQYANTTSSLAHVRLDAHGRSAGWILSDGTEIATSPAQSTLLNGQVNVGDHLVITAGASNGLTVTDATTGRAVALGAARLAATSRALPSDAPLDDARLLTPLFRADRVAMTLHTPGGHPSGLVLRDGTQVHLVPDVADVLSDVHAGDAVTVRGRGTLGASGSAMWATYLALGHRVLLNMERDASGIPELGL